MLQLIFVFPLFKIHYHTLIIEASLKGKYGGVAMSFSRRTFSVSSDIFLVWLHKQQRGRKRSQTTKAPLACFTTHNSNITIEVLYKLMAMANRHCHLCDLPEIKPETWVPNNSFLLHTLTTTFKAIQSTFRSLEMHSKRRYKICITVRTSYS